MPSHRLESASTKHLGSELLFQYRSVWANNKGDALPSVVVPSATRYRRIAQGIFTIADPDISPSEPMPQYYAHPTHGGAGKAPCRPNLVNMV